MQESHDGDDYLLKVLHELQRGTEDSSYVATSRPPTDFHSSTLEELTRRIRLEKDLRSEIARLTWDVGDLYNI